MGMQYAMDKGGGSAHLGLCVFIVYICYMCGRLCNHAPLPHLAWVMEVGVWVVGCLPVWIYCIHLYYTLSTGVNPGLCLSEGMRMWGNGFQAWGIKCPETFLFRKLHAGFSPHFLCSAPTWQFFHHECLFFFRFASRRINYSLRVLFW